MKLLDKVAVVTGASSGLGRAIALLYAKEGAKVVAVARRKERLDEIVKISKNYKGSIVAFQGDLSNKEDNEKMIEKAIELYGKIDILVNNAGIVDGMFAITEMEDETWLKVLDVNLTAPFYSSRKALEYMIKQGSGNIINMSSVAGLNGGRAGIGYTATKHALVGMSKNIGFMYADKGIRCNAICPGSTKSEMTENLGELKHFGMQRAISGAGNSVRVGEAEEVATIALFLASDDSSFINGETIVCDAGWTAY
jgi:NAD(P)-dependent dehydrogenase (short-subunit alcohol dehydrogenase family)